MKEMDELNKPVDNTSEENQTKDSGYWRSFKELYNDPAFDKTLKNEFSPEALQKPDVANMSAVTRRRFLALMGASAAFAAAGCGNYQDKGTIVPYNQKPEEVTLGLPNYYASTCTGCTSACGILVKTREGRPIKVDGNPDHPVNKGKICTKGQASVMNLYNPERLKEPIMNKAVTNWNDVNKNVTAA
ncbi:MAG TPA: TAT-variant-translocated molybdopterin oxidoreductase, partial [Ignavibacteria bacterium]|nr:TAT-variant-translocated molybdopterin oxidoreductase [Ignavibacteria bacterium]